MIDIELKAEHIDEVQALLRAFPQQAPAYIAAAVNSALPVIARDLLAAVVAANVIDESAAVNTMRLTQATPARLVAMIRSSGYVPSLMRYDTAPALPQYRPEVRSRVKRANAPKAMPHAFITQVRAGNVHVVIREPGTLTRYTSRQTGRTRIGEKLRVLHGPAPSSLFASTWDSAEAARGELTAKGENVIREQLDAALDYLRSVR